jgi:DNA helicase-2/ATP-dependent DNA helicase PcrA
MQLPGAEKITLPPLSYRDPSGTLPAAAEAAMQRDFTHEAIRTAAAAGRISVTDYAEGHGHAEVIDLARRARKDGDTVSIFTHTNLATSSLSDALLADGLVHEQVGLTEAHGEALAAQLALAKFALNLPGSRVLRALAVYVQATERRGNRVVPLAQQMLNPKTNPPLMNALNRLARNLRASVGADGHPDVAQLAEAITNAYNMVGAARGQETWLQAARQTRNVLRRADQGSFEAAAVEEELVRVRDEALVGAGVARQFPIQVMNLHQTKGREADTTILLLGENEFHGSEGEPYPTGSKLLYVVMTRARKKAHLVVPDLVHGLWEPLVAALR